MITVQADILIAFNIRLKQQRLINTGSFKTIYFECNNTFETRIDVEVRVWVNLWLGCGFWSGTCKKSMRAGLSVIWI